LIEKGFFGMCAVWGGVWVKEKRAKPTPGFLFGVSGHEQVHWEGIPTELVKVFIKGLKFSRTIIKKITLCAHIPLKMVINSFSSNFCHLPLPQIPASSLGQKPPCCLADLGCFQRDM